MTMNENHMKSLISNVALVAAIVMPFFNIPLIYKIIKRKSSGDISVSWVLGVWICIVLMAPAGFTSQDLVWRTFNYVNFLFFTVVMIVVCKYRKGNK